jgi:hypothetical protein
MASAVIVQDRALARALSSLPPGERTVQAAWSGLPLQSSESLRQLDADARATLERASGREPFAAMVFRDARFGGALVELGGLDDVGRWVQVSRGRLPRPCTPRRCEVVRVGGTGPLPAHDAIAVVGIGTLRRSAPVGAFFGRVRNMPVLVANGIFGVSGLPEGDLIARSYSWIVPLDRRTVHSWDVDGFLRRVDRAGAELETHSTIFGVTAPTDELRALASASRVSGRRLLIVGGESAALVLAFALLAATRLRRDTEAAWRRLTWFGARRWQLVTLSAVESGVTAALAALVGWLVGIAVAAAIAAHVSVPVWPVLRQSVLSARGLLLALALAAAAAAMVLASLKARLPGFGGLTIGVADVAALGALAAIALALARGDTNTSALARGSGSGVVLLLMPALVVLVAAVVVARLLEPALRLLERAGRRAGPAFRLAALSLARARGAAVAAVVFLVVSVGLATFAAAYRATLSTNQRDEASFAVPADYVLRENNRRLVTVQQAAPASAYRAVGGSEVFRASGNVTGLGAQTPFTLLGLSPAVLERVGGWRSDFAGASRRALARRLNPAAPVRERGVYVPGGARSLGLPVQVRGNTLALALAIRNARGDFTTLTFDPVRSGRRVLRARLPRPARGGRIVALSLSLPVVEAFLAGHAESGRTTGVSDNSTGVLSLGAPEISTASGTKRLRAGYRSWIGVDGVTPLGPGRVRYVVNRSTEARFRPRQETDDHPIPVLATPAVAAAAGAGGILPIAVENEALTARVVGKVKLFPGTRGDAVVADLGTVTTALNAVRPGLGVPNELWAWPPAAQAQRLRLPPSVLDVTSRHAVEAALRDNPLAHGSLLLLGSAALVALALALVGLALVVVADLRDGRAELFDLETQGAGPSALRRHVRLRALLVAGVGTLGGLATGAVLSALVVDTVAVTANAAEPLPPLRLVVDWPLLALGVAAFLALSAAVVVLITTSSFREAVPAPASEASL